MEAVLVASRDVESMDAICAVASSKYSISTITDVEQFSSELLQTFRLLIVDQTFTDFKGVDFLMQVSCQHHIPILFLSAADDPESAAEALNSGAFNFVVKTSSYPQVLVFAMKDSIRRFYEVSNLQATIINLKETIARLTQNGGVESTPESSGARKADDRLSGKLLKEIVSLLKTGDLNLPTYSTTVRKFKQLVADGGGMKEITQVLQCDASISSKLISVSNTAYYRGMSPVKTLEQAISRIGIGETRNHVELIANRSLYVGQSPQYEVYLRKLWSHSLATANFAQEIARSVIGVVPTEVFSMGLFHDIGKLLLVQILSELQKRGAYSEGLDESVWVAFIRANHSHFGANLVKRWQLPPVFSTVALWHEDPAKAPEEMADVWIVCLANELAIQIGYGEMDAKNISARLFSDGCEKLGISDEKISEIKVSVKDVLEESKIA